MLSYPAEFDESRMTAIATEDPSRWETEGSARVRLGDGVVQCRIDSRSTSEQLQEFSREENRLTVKKYDCLRY